MKNTITRAAAVTGTLLAAVLLAGCGGASTASTSGVPAPTGSPSVSAAASAKAVVPASGAADSGLVTSSPNSIFDGTATLESFRITVKRTVDAQGNSVLSVKAQPTKASWTFRKVPLPAPFYADQISLDDVTVKDSKDQPLQRTSNTPIAFAVPSGSDTDTIKVSLSVRDQATTTVAGYNPSAMSAPKTAEENFEIKDVPITLVPDTK